MLLQLEISGLLVKLFVIFGSAAIIFSAVYLSYRAWKKKKEEQEGTNYLCDAQESPPNYESTITEDNGEEMIEIRTNMDGDDPDDFSNLTDLFENSTLDEQDLSSGLSSNDYRRISIHDQQNLTFPTTNPPPTTTIAPYSPFLIWIIIGSSVLILAFITVVASVIFGRMLRKKKKNGSNRAENRTTNEGFRNLGKNAEISGSCLSPLLNKPTSEPDYESTTTTQFSDTFNIPQLSSLSFSELAREPKKDENAEKFQSLSYRNKMAEEELEKEIEQEQGKLENERRKREENRQKTEDFQQFYEELMARVELEMKEMYRILELVRVQTARNKIVENEWHQFFSMMSRMQKPIDEIQLEKLANCLEKQINAMKKIDTKMGNLFNTHQKHFLVDIQISANEVKQPADEFLTAVHAAEKAIRESNIIQQDQLQEAHKKLRKASLHIPTVMKLKEKYKDWKPE
ncbi:unnamed protein product [Caenorhabditis auriculariae]|uniref:Uncharacterized protein n=1 Tax=Caenorhabditis auriculariae TaxID=2777116 RepID=A0A8S1H8X2_9PELO|nr:unnamed protein product [Caenorhabditis auriculariae]